MSGIDSLPAPVRSKVSASLSATTRWSAPLRLFFLVFSLAGSARRPEAESVMVGK
jgi:hypothetical protein